MNQENTWILGDNSPGGFPNLPLTIRAGTFDLGVPLAPKTTVADENSPGSFTAVTFGPDVVLAGGNVLERLRQTTLAVADLSGDRLGQFDGRAITLDDDAAGHGWFLDPTPYQDEEFTPTAVERAFAALAGGPAADRIDLLTVVLHELGHELGLEHLDPAVPGEGLMTAFLDTGTRRLP